MVKDCQPRSCVLCDRHPSILLSASIIQIFYFTVVIIDDLKIAPESIYASQGRPLKNAEPALKSALTRIVARVLLTTGRDQKHALFGYCHDMSDTLLSRVVCSALQLLACLKRFPTCTPFASITQASATLVMPADTAQSFQCNNVFP